MIYARLRRFSATSRWPQLLGAALLLAGIALALPGAPAKADDPVAADGAVGANIDWENGKSTYYYIELQRQGLFSIVGGMASENDSEIRQGLLEFDWGINHQASDGSWPGSAGADIGPQFHCTSWFVEACAHAALLLKTYSPTTYTLDTSYYNAEIARLTSCAKAGAYWLMSPSIEPAGWQFDGDCTHRRYLLAAGLAETAALTGDSTLKSDSITYVKDGLSRQLGAGWTAAITRNSDGSYPPATLLAPGASAPAGTVKIVSAVGVNPEKSGYDSSYQGTGIYLANVYNAYCTDSTIRQQLVTMTKAGLLWERSEVAPDGTISYLGDSRMGQEVDRNGNVKLPEKGITRGAFNQGYVNTGVALDTVFADRIYDKGTAIDSNAVSQYGAVDGNEAWEGDKTLPWSIGAQKIAVDYVEEGIKTENDAEIQQGLLIFNWGFVHQKSDGSFGTTQSPCSGGAAFIEAAARAGLELRDYTPQTYTPATSYVRWASSAHAGCVAYCNWLTTTSAGNQAQAACARSSSALWTEAAALCETGGYTAAILFRREAAALASSAISLQTSTGEQPESGASDPNSQITGLSSGLHYAAMCDDPASLEATNTALDSALLWESQYVGVKGTLSSKLASTQLLPLRRTYGLAGASDALTDEDIFEIVRWRLGDMPTE